MTEENIYFFYIPNSISQNVNCVILDFMRKEGTGWGLGTRGRLNKVKQLYCKTSEECSCTNPVGFWPLRGITFLGPYSVDHSLGNNVSPGFLAPEAAM